MHAKNLGPRGRSTRAVIVSFSAAVALATASLAHADPPAPSSDARPPAPASDAPPPLPASDPPPPVPTAAPSVAATSSSSEPPAPAPKSSPLPSASATNAPSGEPPSSTPPGRRAGDQRHLGFYLRMEIGVGSLRTSATTSAGSLSISGIDGAFSAAIGGAVMENLIVAGELWAASATSPQVTLNDVTVSTTDDVSLNLAGIGPSVTYYLMPANVFASISPSLGRVTIKDGRDASSAATRLGFATRLAIGKEWWVARNLGIGIAGNLHLGVNQDELATDTSRITFYWTTLAGGLAFSGTYN